MSCRSLLTLVSRSLPPDPSSRFCVLSSTPRPALEMYSSREQSTVTVPWTPSKKLCARGASAASRRPVINTTPSGPDSIASIGSILVGRASGSGCSGACLAKRDPALPALLRVFVFDRIEHAPNQMQPQAARMTLLDRQCDVRIGRLGHVERFHAAIDQRHLDAIVEWDDFNAHRLGRRGAVFDHFS